MLPGQMNRSGKLHALLSTARVANVPSVVSNVWLGWVIGMWSAGSSSSPSGLGPGFFLLPLAGIFLYLSGNFLNDWMDREWDARHRPERALPSRVFCPELYAVIAPGLAVLGLAAAFTASVRSGWVAVAIVISILIYTALHKQTAWAVIAMGLCRALLPVMGSIALFPYIDTIWPAAGALLCYIMGLSLSARYESLAEPPPQAAILSRAFLLGTAVLVAWGNRNLFVTRWPNLAGVLPYLLWTSLCLRIWRRPVPVLVSRLLAGIPLVDWMTLLPLFLMLVISGGGEPSAAQISSFLVPPAVFLLALLLQRLAPAT
ncbi:MAG: UbiA family prenyltransferase [Luteolibacter sp.]